MSKLLIACAAACLVGASVFAADPLFVPEKGDHICIIGSGLADRMQHDGWLETYLYTEEPGSDLVFRNLAYAGDEIVRRARSENFGTPDDWLTRGKADVIFAFFGYNESFKGYDGIAQFKADLDAFLKANASKNYSGNGAPKVILFSPTAAEKLPDPNFPDPKAINTNLKNYTDAMAEVAKANGVPFVDLFTISEKLYAAAKQPLTIDTVHLTADGDKLLAAAVTEVLLGKAAPNVDTPAAAKLRAAIVDRNETWHARYRTIDGYNVYGGRSKLAYTPGKGGFVYDRQPPAPAVSNFQVMQEEMTQRDVMTQNRDKAVIAIAKGDDFIVKDDNLPPVQQVATNLPGKNPDSTHKFLGGEEAISHMTVPPGCKVNLFASEEQFPELIKPVQMNWDTKGRLWVAAWRNYPERTPDSKVGDSILIFEDVDGDGKADKCTHFIDNLNCPTGFQFYKDGILLMQAPDLLFVRDTDGDGKADSVERVMMGLDSADSHHTTNSMVLDPGGAVYLSDGVFHRTQAESAYGPVLNEDAAIYRYEPRTGKFETYIAYGFANPHGRVFDYWGNDLITDATGNNTYFGPAFSGKIDFPQKHLELKQYWDRPSRPCAGTGILSSTHFPAEFQENFLNCNVISFQGIYRVKNREEGSGLWGTTIKDNLVSSDDPNFRPTGVNSGPDGAVYFLDWQNAIIGHMQHHLRDPNRDHKHGRIYRITYPANPLTPIVKVAGEPIEKLIELLKRPENDIRTRAKIELGGRDSNQVIAAVNKWAAGLDKTDPAYEHHMLEALWVHQWLNVVDTALLNRMLHSPEPRARTAATRVLCYWREYLPDALSLLKVQAADESPMVRLQAVRTASFFTGKEALDVAFETIRHDTDYYIDYTFKETMRELQPKGKEPILPSDNKALSYVILHMSDAELAAASPIEQVLQARIDRKSTAFGDRDGALTKLAALHKTNQAVEIVAALHRADAASDASAVGDFAKSLVLAPAADLTQSLGPLKELATKAKLPDVKRAAWAGVLTATGKPEAIWKDATAAEHELIADSLALLVDPAIRSSFQPLLVAELSDSTIPDGSRRAALRALPLTGAENASADYAILAKYIQSGRERSIAARAALQLPRTAWSAETAPAVSEAILAWARTVPEGDRAQQEYVETIQFGSEVASLLPAPEAARIRKALRDLSVSIFVVHTVQEQMRYDTPRIVVEAGKPVQIIFENADRMPHNFVIVAPGAREAIGEKAQTMQPTPDKNGRAYIPEDKRIIIASKLMEYGEKETLKFTAPTEPGKYEYVCTFPGHWAVMFGELLVTNDVDAALAAAPTPASAAPAAAGAAHQHAH